MMKQDIDSEQSRNVVLVTVDSLRADHCGFMGCVENTTPNLDSFAKKGIIYENAIAPGPRTPSSMPIAFTGKQTNEPPVGEFEWRERRRRIARHLVRCGTISSHLSSRGYTTAALTVNPWTASDTKFDSGFDEFVESPSNEETWPRSIRALDTLITRLGLEDRFNWHNKQDWLAQWPQYYEQIRDLTTDLQEPYFLWVFLLDTHQPYLAPAEYRAETTGVEMYYAAFEYWNHLYRGSNNTLPASTGARIRRAYRDAIRSVDGFVNRLHQDLKSDNPVIVFHSDHGEAFGEHGTYGHQQTLYEENIHVPLLIFNTDVQKRSDAPVSLQSIPKIVSSVSLSQTPDVGSEVVTSQTEDGRSLALRSRQWKYIENGERVRLFALQHDPDETADVSSQVPEVTKGFRDLAGNVRNNQFERQTIFQAVSNITGEKVL